jgi:hypothetical protein
MRDHQAKCVYEKPAESVFGEFPSGHRKFAVLPGALAAHMSFDTDVVWGIRKNGGGLLASEERAIRVRIQGVPAEEAMIAKRPKVA